MTPLDPIASLEEAALNHYRQGQTSRLALADDLTAMHAHRSTREIAEWAKTNGLEGLDSHARIVQLTRWSELVHYARHADVVTAVTTPGERTLRPLFAKRLDLTLHEQSELLGDALKLAADEGVALSSRHVALAIEAVHPKPEKRTQGKEVRAKVRKGLESCPKPNVGTSEYASWRAQKRTAMSGHEAYCLAELIVLKFGTLDDFAAAVRAEQAVQAGLPDVLPEIEPGQGSDPRPGGLGDRIAQQETT